MTLSMLTKAPNHHVHSSRTCGLQLTDMATEHVYAHGAPRLPGCMPMVAVTHLSSSLSQLKLLYQTTGQCEEQILSNNKKIKKKCHVLVSTVLSALTYSSNNSYYKHQRNTRPNYHVIFKSEKITIATVR